MPHLVTPGPDKAQLDLILSAGMRAPDHGGLTPWHFTLVEGSGLTRMSEILLNAATARNFDEAKLSKVKNMPFRAPMVIVVSTRYQAHPKVPKQEQMLAAGCCVHAMQLAVFSIGMGGVWRTGEFSYDDQVKQQLGIARGEDIVGFLYLGTKAKSQGEKPAKSYENYVSYL